MKRWIGWLVLLAVLIEAWTCFFTVHETQHAIVTRFGDPVRVLTEPGLGIKWPWPVDVVRYFDSRLQVYDHPGPDYPAKEFLTQDKKNIEVATYTCWRISDTLRFYQNVYDREGAEARLSDIVVSELGTTLGHFDLSALISIDPEQYKRDHIVQQITTACAQRAARDYGIEIVDFRIKRIDFPVQNRSSVFDRMRAERKRIATRFRSEGDEQATEIRAAADKERVELLSEAYRQAKEIEGKAEAEAAHIYAQAYEQDPEFYEFLRTLESYETSLKKGTTVIISQDSRYLRLLTSPRALTTEPALVEQR
jgi:membrane protease subunit HflC